MGHESIASLESRPFLQTEWNFERVQRSLDLHLHYMLRGDLLRRLGVREADGGSGQTSLFLLSVAILSLSAVTALVFLYAIVVSKFMPNTGVYLLDYIKHDQYFCFLLPLSVLPTYLYIYVNWLSLTYFRHN